MYLSIMISSMWLSCAIVAVYNRDREALNAASGVSVILAIGYFILKMKGLI